MDIMNCRLLIASYRMGKQWVQSKEEEEIKRGKCFYKRWKRYAENTWQAGV